MPSTIPLMKTFYLGRIVQAAAQRCLHPCARSLCSAQDWIAAAVADQRAVLRITSEEHSTDIMPREISAHVRTRRGCAAARSVSAVPKSFSSSPNSGAPFQRTCQTACVDPFLPFEFNDFTLSRNVANPLGATFGSVITHRLAVTTRGRSPSLSASCWPAVFRCREFVQQKKNQTRQ